MNDKSNKTTTEERPTGSTPPGCYLKSIGDERLKKLISMIVDVKREYMNNVQIEMEGVLTPLAENELTKAMGLIDSAWYHLQAMNLHQAHALAKRSR